jgi:hypothetical protein
MKTVIFALLFFASSSVALGQTAIEAFGTKILFKIPDEKVWTLVQEATPSEKSKGIRIFKCAPIIGTKGLPVEPVLALFFEQVTESIDTIVYSANGLMSKQQTFKLKWNLLGTYPEYSSDQHSVVYKAEYTRSGFIHKVYLCYILYRNIGVEIIADSTDDVFDQVDADMRAFIKSIVIQEQPLQTNPGIN